MPPAAASRFAILSGKPERAAGSLAAIGCEVVSAQSTCVVAMTRERKSTARLVFMVVKEYVGFLSLEIVLNKKFERKRKKEMGGYYMIDISEENSAETARLSIAGHLFAMLNIKQETGRKYKVKLLIMDTTMQRLMQCPTANYARAENEANFDNLIGNNNSAMSY